MRLDNVVITPGTLLLDCPVNGYITFAEIALGLWLLRVPYFAVIAFIIALLDILPFLGSGLFLIPWGLFHLLPGRGRRHLPDGVRIQP